jgi:Aldehyde ferredoxin oxidoreductase, domains 2 & 3
VLLRAVTGWDVDAAELRATARRIVLAKRVFNLREGATAADDTLPRRLLETPLELSSGRTAALTEDRLRAMVGGYSSSSRSRRYCRSTTSPDLPVSYPPSASTAPRTAALRSTVISGAAASRASPGRTRS